MSDYEVFEAGDVDLHFGGRLSNVRIGYKTHGTLSAAKDNVVVFPCRVGGTHEHNTYLIGDGMALDPAKRFIVIPNLLGNGVSTSPSNAANGESGPDFPALSHHDNATLQMRLLEEALGIEKISLAVGFSMGGQQAYHLAARFPDRVDRLATICTLAKTPPHTMAFLEGVKASMTEAIDFDGGRYTEKPVRALKALARVWSGWGLSQAFYRERLYEDLGFETVDDFLVGWWEARYAGADPNNMIAMMDTWKRSDISDCDAYGGDIDAALGAITARTFVMPCRTDLYFPPEDNEVETAKIPNAEMRPIESVWGHLSAGGANADDTAFIDAQLKELLAS